MQKHLLTAMAALCIAFAAAQAPTAGLVAYWPLNGNFSDASGTGISTTNMGATATTNNLNNVNTAMAFSNPTNTPVQYALQTVNSAINFGTAQNFTITCAVYFNSPYVHYTGIYDNNLNYYGYGVWAWNANGFLQAQFNYRNGSVGTTNGAIMAGTWVHLTCVRSAGVIRIYVNGVQNNSATEGVQTPAYPYTPAFGGMYFNAQSPPVYNPLHGKLDEIRIYNRALTAAEITQTYDAWANAALPVTLTSFTAALRNGDALLNWQTVTEQNSSHFNIQRSTDGSSFTNIGTVQSRGNSSVTVDYNFTDNTVKNLQGIKTVYYRLEQVDKDGRRTMSSTVKVRNETSGDLLTILQNPVENDLALEISLVRQQPVQLLVTDATGRTLLSRNTPMQGGSNFTALPVKALSPGNYYITLLAGTAKETRAFIKQ
ncbi:MAG: LamG-like jellyroll fold domain-containing protein [Ferruginibacter sp.]